MDGKIEALADRWGRVYYAEKLDKYLVGLPDMGDYNNEEHFDRGTWGRGATIGGIYKITPHAKERMGCNSIHLGEFEMDCGAKNVIYIVNKKDLIKLDTLCVCYQHSGDCFFNYILLHDDHGILKPVHGMDFGAYSFDKPLDIVKTVATKEIKKVPV